MNSRKKNDKNKAKIKKGDLRSIFGTLKTKMSGQEFKDLTREGWN